MKSIVLYVSILCLAITAHAQKETGVFFNDAQPKDEEVLQTYFENMVGDYQKEDDKYVSISIDTNTISLEYLVRVSLPLKEIQNNPKYQLSGGRIYGIDSSKGLDFLLENDTVHFGIYQTEPFIAFTESTIVKKIEDKYIISQKNKNDLWDCTLIYKKENKLYIRFIDPMKDKDKLKSSFNSLKTQKVDGKSVFVVNASNAAFKKFVNDKGFYEILTFVEE